MYLFYFNKFKIIFYIELETNIIIVLIIFIVNHYKL